VVATGLAALRPVAPRLRSHDAVTDMASHACSGSVPGKIRLQAQYPQQAPAKECATAYIVGQVPGIIPAPAKQPLAKPRRAPGQRLPSSTSTPHATIHTPIPSRPHDI